MTRRTGASAEPVVVVLASAAVPVDPVTARWTATSADPEATGVRAGPWPVSPGPTAPPLGRVAEPVRFPPEPTALPGEALAALVGPAGLAVVPPEGAAPPPGFAVGL
ncbi:hypothetical protein [Streptomyces griseiscabiei]|uniref:hypothetical protein n=1 Tax=Streptomyces griseiscabiei TaxID=2993540 RepID=UPI00117F649D|nr:hypothetical protein [Streptomyces griseiscabiei]